MNRNEMIEQRKQMEQQTMVYNKMQLENTFFNHLNLHHEILNNIDLGFGEDQATGFDCFKKFYARLKLNFGETNTNEEGQMNMNILLKKINESINKLFLDHDQDLEHYMNHLFVILSKFGNTIIVQIRNTGT